MNFIQLRWYQMTLWLMDYNVQKHEDMRINFCSYRYIFQGDTTYMSSVGFECLSSIKVVNVASHFSVLKCLGHQLGSFSTKQ